MVQSRIEHKEIILILNLNRHSDLYNLAKYVEALINSQSKRARAKILVSQQNYDSVQVNDIFVSKISMLMRVMRKKRPSWIYITGPSLFSFIALCIQKLLFRKNAVTHLHRFDYYSFPIVKGLAMWLYNALVTQISDFCVVHSESVAARHKNYLYALLPFHARRGNIKKQNKKSELNILFFGRIDKNKGLVRVLELAKLMPTANFFIYGEIVDKTQIKVIQKLRELSNCTVSSKRVQETDIPNAFSGKDVVLLPYFDGTQSGIPNLSSVYGVPVLSTPFGEISTIIDSNKCGIYHEYSALKWSQILSSTNWQVLSEQICIDSNAVHRSYVKVLESFTDHI